MEAHPPQEISVTEALPAQEADAQAETGMEETKNIPDETGDLQETTDANGDIMEVDKSENTFADFADAEKETSDALGDGEATSETGLLGGLSEAFVGERNQETENLLKEMEANEKNLGFKISWKS